MPDPTLSPTVQHPSAWPLWAGTAREATNAKIQQVRRDHPDAVVRVYFMGSRQQVAGDLPISQVAGHQSLVDVMSPHGSANYLWIATTPGGTMKALGIVAISPEQRENNRSISRVDAKFW